jgi:hypothetical protein
MQIGFSQRIQLEWLEQTAQLFLGGNSKAQIEMALQDMLRDRLSVGSNTRRNSREKAITILMKIWVTVPNHLKPFRDDAIKLLKKLPESSHLPIHWGMAMSAYPFFGVIAENVGRLLRLQGTVAASHVQRRIREKLGERETVTRSARRILRCFVDWGVLQDTRKRGIYKATPQLPVKNKRLKSWLIEAALISNGFNSLLLRSLFEKPVFFPFNIRQITLMELESNFRLNSFRQGLDEDMVTLKNDKNLMKMR